MTKKAKELKAMGEAQLNERLGQIRMELVKMNTQVASGTNPKNPGLIRQSKRGIARILTILNLKKLGGAKKPNE
jgi:large subunit ribosomal protein L29